MNAPKLIFVLETLLPIGANPRMSCGYATLEHPAALSHTLKHVSGSAHATVSIKIKFSTKFKMQDEQIIKVCLFDGKEGSF